MCRSTREEEITKSGLNWLDLSMMVDSGHVKMGSIFCELCSSRASLYCPADKGFLCWNCDKQVHKANFLAMRHIRCILCDTCQNLTCRYIVGASLKLILRSISHRRQCNPKNCVKCPRIITKKKDF
ncbi:zinc finger protein [Macleaya cordata]|uniref:Zinc finger protein n=1 Tax=Macleaya cordata TaxID=56857 RepID=A0A200QKD8_MACCD|nr:zinc finger protein [Macleaya cordata]